MSTFAAWTRLTKEIAVTIIAGNNALALALRKQVRVVIESTIIIEIIGFRISSEAAEVQGRGGAGERGDRNPEGARAISSGR